MRRQALSIEDIVVVPQLVHQVIENKSSTFPLAMFNAQGMRG